MQNHLSTTGRQALHGIWDLEVARRNGFQIVEVPPSPDEVKTYGNRPREAEVYYHAEFVGKFAISERRDSKEYPNTILRWINDVPLPNTGRNEKRYQINLDPKVVK
jgi:hypothetical protein